MAASFVGVLVAGGAVVVGVDEEVSVICASCLPQADKAIPITRIIESIFLDIGASFERVN
jgi:hypothetical protein